VGGRIVETEAYTDAEDAGSHSYRGRTPRNFLMFEEPARLYVYFIYGNHYCANIVAHPPGRAGAVLVRALEPLWGLPRMLERRGQGRENQLTNGPGKLCQALAIDKTYNGQRLGDLILPASGADKLGEIGQSVRIGLKPGKGEHLPWRFFLKDNRWVSGGIRKG
jgi:DNA-3-methyladenine glycosylase